MTSLWYALIKMVVPSFEVSIEEDTNLSGNGFIIVKAKISHNDIVSENLLYTFSLNEFIVEEENAIKEDFYYSLVIGGMDSDDADLIIANMVMVANDMVSAGDYSLKNNIIFSCTVHLLSSEDEIDFDISEAVQESIDAMEVHHVPTCKEVIEALDVSIYKLENGKEEEDCVICLKTFLNGCELMYLKCGHYFGKDCIIKWLNTSNICPLFRFEHKTE